MQNIKYCPKCNQIAPSAKNTFCPFDATPLIEMQPSQPPESIRSRPAEVTKAQFSEEAKVPLDQNKGVITLDCTACKTPNSMMATNVPKFSSIVRVIGSILLVPSFLGIAFALLVFVSTIISTISLSNKTVHSEAQQAGQAIGFGIGFMFSLIVGVISLVGGLIGWLLLLNRHVYKCQRCGFILDRA